MGYSTPDPHAALGDGVVEVHTSVSVCLYLVKQVRGYAFRVCEADKGVSRYDCEALFHSIVFECPADIWLRLRNSVNHTRSFSENSASIRQAFEDIRARVFEFGGPDISFEENVEDEPTLPPALGEVGETVSRRLPDVLAPGGDEVLEIPENEIWVGVVSVGDATFKFVQGVDSFESGAPLTYRCEDPEARAAFVAELEAQPPFGPSHEASGILERLVARHPLVRNKSK